MFECFEEFADFISKRLSLLRSKNNISARDMSLTMGQGQAYINNIENKNSMPSMQGFYYICEFLKISPKDFFDDGVENPEKLSNLITDLKTLNEEQLATVTSVVKGLKK